MNSLDPRLHPNRPALADGKIRTLNVPIATLHRRAGHESMQMTQVLMGERVRVLEQRDGWAWAQLVRDGYVGYLRETLLIDDADTPTHRVWVPSTLMYPAADIKSQPAIALPMNAEVAATGEDGKYLQLANGSFIYSRHAKPVGQHESDFVAVAEMFLHVPYLWGGKSAAGLDCSGLVQLSLEACGIASRRDSDMQEAEFGEAIRVDGLDGLRRGDLVFWNGHVGIMTDAENLLHSNGYHMQVVREPLSHAVDRIAAFYGPVTSIRRR